MTSDELKALQGPLKERYRAFPETARRTLRAEGSLVPGTLECAVDTWLGRAQAGLHPATGGDGTRACSADMVLQALVACAGVTVQAVATAIGVELRGGRLVAEGDLDFRGTLGVSRETPVGMTAVRLRIELDTDAPAEQVEKLVQLAERYCVVARTLRNPPSLEISTRVLSGDGRSA
jgi:uncharacterized OsmC-like protein